MIHLVWAAVCLLLKVFQRGLDDRLLSSFFLPQIQTDDREAICRLERIVSRNYDCPSPRQNLCKLWIQRRSRAGYCCSRQFKSSGKIHCTRMGHLWSEIYLLMLHQSAVAPKDISICFFVVCFSWNWIHLNLVSKWVLQKWVLGFVSHDCKRNETIWEVG